jgi:hypothetical protein
MHNPIVLRKVLALWCVIIGGALYILGGRLLRDSLANSTLKQVTYKQARNAPLSFGWVRITGGRVDLSRSVQEVQGNVPVRAYAPIFSATDPAQTKTALFLEVDNPKYMRLLLDEYQQQRSGGEAARRQWLQAHRREMILTQNIEGMVYQGIYRPTEDLNAKFAEVSDTDYTQFMMIAQGWKPDPKRAYIELGVGTLFALAAVGLFLRSRT